MATTQEKLQVLLHEHQNINNKIDQFISDQFKYITTLITLSAGFIYFSFESENETIKDFIVLLPYLLIIIAPTFLFKFNRVIILHGYRAYLEDKINHHAEEQLMFGARLVKEKLLHKNPFAILNYSVLGLFFIVATIACHANSDWETIDYIYIISQLAFIIIGFILFFLKNKKAFDEGYDYNSNP